MTVVSRGRPPVANIIRQLPLALSAGDYLQPDGDACMRWDRKLVRWRYREENRFRSADWEVAEVDESTAKAYCQAHHYSASYPAASRRFGLYARDGRLEGVIVFSVPARAEVLSRPFNVPPSHPALYDEFKELGRMVLSPAAPANTESWMLAECFRRLARDGVRGVVSFSDPVPRSTLDGRILHVGHAGIVYQAANATYLGRSDARYLLLLPDGSVFSERAASKIRNNESGHEYAERTLQAFGAPLREPGEPGSEWLSRALPSARVRRLHHGGNHRYVWRLNAERGRVAYGLPALPYPKPLQPA